MIEEKKNKGVVIMKKFLTEFKEFALRGNVMDLAVGVIIGAAFQAIINSLVNDVLSPLIGLVAKTDLTYLHFTINEVDVKYGSFLTAVINFIIMVFVIFLLVKGMNALASLGKRNEVEEEEEVTTKICPFCQSEIDIKASRCPHCTSELPDLDKLEEAAEAAAAKE
jgi:large conductance mechanosensitive channel